MHPSLKSFIGMVALVALVVIYSLVAITVATYRLAESPWYVHLAFFGISGILWVLPGMFIVKWMVRPPADGEAK